jgi:hypothetical protein
MTRFKLINQINFIKSKLKKLQMVLLQKCQSIQLRCSLNIDKQGWISKIKVNGSKSFNSTEAEPLREEKIKDQISPP